MDFFSRTRKGIIVIAALTAALVQVFFIAALRWREEKANDSVEIAVFLDEIFDFSAQHGVDFGDFMRKLKSAGATTVVVGETSLEKLGRKGLADIKVESGQSLRSGYTYVVPDFPDTADAIERALAARLGRDRVTRGESSGMAVIEVRAVDRPRRLMFASGAEAHPPGFLRNLPLGFFPDDIARAESSGMRTLFEIYSDGVSDGRVVELTLKPLSVLKPGTICFTGSRALGHPDHLEATSSALASLASRGWKLGLVEFADTKGVLTIASRVPGESLVRIHTMSPEEMTRQTHAKALARWTRAVKERGMRILAVRLDFGDSRHAQGRGLRRPVEENLEYIADIAREVRAKGYMIRPALPPPMGTSGSLTVLGLSIGVSVFAGVAAAIIPGWRFGAATTLSTLLILAAVLLFGLGRVMEMRKGYSLLAALIFPAMTSIVTFRAIPTGRRSFRDTIALAFWAWFRGFVVLLPGIFFIVGLLRHPAFGVKLEQFFGVKAALLGPILLVVLHYMKREGIDFSILKKSVTAGQLAAVGILVVSGALFVLRSGNMPGLRFLGLEEVFRGTLEDVFFARPRTKEILIGFPCLFALVLAVGREWKGIRLPLLLGVTILPVSMLNTFCHIHTPLQMSVLRTGNSILLGLPVGAVAAWFFLLLMTCYEAAGRDLAVGYYGFRNIGDEAILLAMAAFGSGNTGNMGPGILNPAVLSADPDWTVKTIGILAFSRSDTAEILGAVLGSRRVIIGGGGLLQDSTSSLSPVYYSGIGILAALAGKEVIVFANGLGPLNNRSSKYLVCALFAASSAISLRDRESIVLASTLCPGMVFDLVNDPVLEMPILTTGLPDSSRKILVVIPRDLSKRDFGNRGRGLNKAMAAGIFEFLGQIGSEAGTWEVRVIPFQPSDTGVALELARAIGGDAPGAGMGKVVEPNGPADALHEISRASVVLSVRLHGAIMAERTGIPWVSIDYDPKVTAFSVACSGSAGIDLDGDPEFMASEITRRLVEAVALKGGETICLGHAGEKCASEKRIGADGGVEEDQPQSPGKWLIEQCGAANRS